MTLGIFAAAAAAVIWATWTVVSKAGISSSLTPQDLAAIRFGISGLISIPIIGYFKPYIGLSGTRVAALALTGGVPYVLLLYFGISCTPAWHAGLLVNGMTPAIAILLRVITISLKPTQFELVGIVAILTGVFSASASSLADKGTSTGGDLMLIVAAVFFTSYLSLASKWRPSPPQVVLAICFVGAVIYLPIWLFLGPHSLSHINENELVLQVIYQGIMAPLIGMVLIAQATIRCGPVITAAVLSFVPILGALCAGLWLNEAISAFNWFGIASTTVGIIVTIVGKRTATDVAPSLVHADNTP